MRELIPITIFSLLMAYLSHRASGYDPINGNYRRKEWVYYTVMSVALIVFAGLRTGYNDTDLYCWMYRETSQNIGLTEGIDWLKTGENPGFFFTLRLLKRCNVSTQSYIMLFSIFTIGVNLWFFRKYSCNMFLSVLLFITFAGYVFNMAAIKQCTAMALCLIATDRAIRKKYLGFLLYVFLACTFHAYAMMYLIVPLLAFRPWSKYTPIMILIFGVAGFGMQFLLGGLLSVTDMLGEGYDAASFTGEGVNPFRLLVTAVPVGLSLITAGQIAQKEEHDQYMIVNLATLNAEIMFVALFGTANYFARLANYFLPFQAVAIPWLLQQLDYKGKRKLTTIASICYILFFIYSQAIHESFDHHFYSITLWEYLASWF